MQKQPDRIDDPVSLEELLRRGQERFKSPAHDSFWDRQPAWARWVLGTAVVVFMVLPPIAVIVRMVLE